MRRLAQLGTLLLILVALVTPISECFDRWDAPGLGNDVEFGLFALLLALVLVLAVCRLLAAMMLRLTLRTGKAPEALHLSAAACLGRITGIFAPPHSPSPLRI